jgi:hypothetical protein
MVIGIGLIGVAEAQDPRQQVVILDAVPGAFHNWCLNVVSLGSTAAVSGERAGGPSAWLFYPPARSSQKKESLRVVNQGGEIHTSTEVAEFGGGFLRLNNPQSPATPGCAGGYANNTGWRTPDWEQPGDSDLKKISRFQCCVHPGCGWNRVK